MPSTRKGRGHPSQGAITGQGEGVELSRTTARLPPDALAPARARRQAAVRCDRLPLDTADVVLLLTSELVTNAVLYGAGDALLDIQVEAGLISVGVADEGGGDVRAAESWRWPEGGHGLTLVQALANRWGVEPDSNGAGKRVWFEVVWQMTPPEHRAGSAASTA